MVQYTSALLGYKSIHTRDIMFLLSADASIKDNLKISGMFNPFSSKFKYAGTKITDTGYYYYQEGHVDVSQLFTISISYNFKWGETPKKIERSTDYDGDGGGGIL